MYEPVRRYLDILFACLFLVFAAALLGLVAASAIKLGFHRRVVGGFGFAAFTAFLSVGAVRILHVAVVRPQFHRAWTAARAGVPPDKWGVSASQLWAEAETKGEWGPTATLTFARAVVEGSDALASVVLESALPAPGESATRHIDLCLQAALYFALALHDPLVARQRLDQATAIPRSWLLRLLERDYHRLAEAAVLLVEGKKEAAARGLEVWRRRFGRSRQVRAVNAWAVDVMLRELRPAAQSRPG